MNLRLGQKIPWGGGDTAWEGGRGAAPPPIDATALNGTFSVFQ